MNLKSYILTITFATALFLTFPSFSQEINARTEEKSIQLCSAIREVIFSAHEKQFRNLMDKEMKGSHGYQVRGSWRFETVQYASILEWPGATKSYIDNSEERTDTSYQLIRQYVAEFSGMRTVEDARQKFELLNRQIAECRLPLSDTNITILRAIPLDKIKDDLPVAAIDARLYPITVKQADEAQPGQEVVIMTAYERSGRMFNAYMIVEYRLQQTGPR
ncbi:MAG TPA: hypothetical protein VK907_00175 [Phnomibacter sp.]|nr:hypothetical protein [Phnomibacter sp.]